MKSIKSGIYFALILCLTAGCGAKENKKSEQPQKSGPAGYVEQAVFTTLQGDSVQVSDFKGKVVLIDFWETWCKPCIASFPSLQKLQEEFPEDFVVLAVTPGFTNTAKDAKKFVDEHDFDFIYAMDTSKLHKQLGVQVIPYKVFVAANGKYIKSQTGSSGPEQDYEKIKKIIEKYKQKPGSSNSKQ